MSRRWLMLAAMLFVGCTQASRVEVEYEPSRPTDTDFARLPFVVAGIPNAREILLYEGLLSEFWEPQLLEQELNRKKTIKLHGHHFCEERPAIQGTDAE